MVSYSKNDLQSLFEFYNLLILNIKKICRYANFTSLRLFIVIIAVRYKKYSYFFYFILLHDLIFTDVSFSPIHLSSNF